MIPQPITIDRDARILLTGATGFIGAAVLRALQRRGFRKIRCFVRYSSDLTEIDRCSKSFGSKVEIVKGNLLSRSDCEEAVRNASVIYHLAAGTGTKSFADAFMNSVVATRNLLDATLQNRDLKRFVSLSSFTVYDNEKNSINTLDESCPMEEYPELRGDPYCFAKVKQDELIMDYGKQHNLPYVLIRPGVVYGPGKARIHGRVGLDTFGIFLHLGGSNPLPLTFVDNCAEAVVLAGLTEGIDGEVFNVVDDDLPSSRDFLRLYKREVKHFPSIYLPHGVSYLMCLLWEKYSAWSCGQLPPVYNRKDWATSWKRTSYTNKKAKRGLNWEPKVLLHEGLNRYFASCRETRRHA